jgi:hypothetical protein
MYKIFLGGVNAESLEFPGSELNFSKYLKNSGFDLVSNPKEAEFAICVDNEKEFQKNVVRARISKRKTIIIRNEPVVVCPENKMSRTRRRFGLSLDVGRPQSESKNAIPWPQNWNQTLKYIETERERSEKIVMINGNKISFIPGEMYSLRRKAILHLNNLDLYGTNWDMSRKEKIRHALTNLHIAIRGGYFPRKSGVKYYFKDFSKWKGAPSDKQKVLSKYKFCLVIENSAEFMTEKLFDAFFSGCIPIYVGPDLQQFPIPKGLFIQANPNLNSIRKAILDASTFDYNKWNHELRNWLYAKETLNYWSSQFVNERIINIIINYCYNNLDSINES